MEEAAADFVKQYYQIMDSSKRRTLENYYDPNAVLRWNYISYSGPMAIIRFLTGLPTTEHQLDSIKANADGDVWTVEVIGKVALGSGGSQPPFKETFTMAPTDTEGCFSIKQQVFTFGD
ncbi:NTF2-like protein [Clavulina sp. PMI_390]|nr:NTF2-like protein [Clavulina sp. PMI_390]